MKGMLLIFTLLSNYMSSRQRGKVTKTEASVVKVMLPVGLPVGGMIS